MGTTGPLIYVVDDETLIAQTLADILIRAGFRSVAFHNPSSALSAFLTECPDLLISDVVMPEMSGIELAIRVRQEYPKCKVLLMSGQIMTADLLEQARRDGYDFDILPKPLHPDELLEKVRSWMI